MGKILTIARRELAAYFVSPMAYVIGALFLLASGVWFFHSIFVPGQEASLRPLFEGMATLMVFVVPLLTMRLVSEEFRSGTIETLMTAPVSDAQVILGKFLGVMAFYSILLTCTLVFLAMIAAYGQPDVGLAISGYLGMVLLGGMFVSAGLLTSTVTRYQIVSAILGISLLSLLAIVMQWLVATAPEPLNHLAERMSAMTYFQDFARGILDTRGLVYFVSMTAMMLFASVKAMESQRW